MRLARPTGLFLLHSGGVMALLLMTALLPPARGEMLLVPLKRDGQARMIAVALRNGAALRGAGRFDRSIVVTGERARLVLPLLRAGVIAIAASASGCGGEASG